MMAGRLNKPTALRLIQGNPSGKKITKREPKVAVGARMPQGMSPGAQKHWPQIASLLTASRILTKIDATALAAYCELFARWRDAADNIAKHGVTVPGAAGALKISPHWSAFIQATSEMRRYLAEFGMTPAARVRVSAVGKDSKKDEDPFADFE